MTQIKLTRNDSGKTVQAEVGETLVIELPENPTTGYVWILDIVQVGKKLHVNNSSFRLVNDSEIGRKGMRTFVIDVLSAGTATIKIKLRRRWEPVSATIESFEAVIEARV